MAVLIALASSVIGAGVLATWFARGGGIVILDHPNERSLHEVPTPRTGGIAIFIAMAVAHCAGAAFGILFHWLVPIAVAASLVFAVSVVDDFRPLPALVRIVVHALGAIMVVMTGYGLVELRLPGVQWALSPVVGAVLSVLLLTWLTNLYNFMDGMDGFAAGMGVIGFSIYAVLATLAAQPTLAVTSAIVAASCLGFLRENFPPATLFMGDAGSSVLGFLAGALALYAQHVGAFPVWLALVVFSPFVVDASVTLLRRAFDGEVLWHAHRSHFYQRLVQLGWGHRRTSCYGYVLMLVCGILAIAIRQAPSWLQWLALSILILVYTMIAWGVRRLEQVRDT